MHLMINACSASKFESKSIPRAIGKRDVDGNPVTGLRKAIKWRAVAFIAPVRATLYLFPMGVRLSQGEAVKRMRELGFEPLEPFVSTKTPWKSRHLACGSIVTPKLGLVSSLGGGCWECRNKKLAIPESEAIAIMLSKNLKPLEPYKSAQTKWKSECLICGGLCKPSLSDLRNGQGGCVTCGYKNRKRPKINHSGVRVLQRTEADALAILKDVGRTALAPYPGLGSLKWKSSCNTCGSVGEPTLNALVKRGNQCKVCGIVRTSTAKYLTQEEVADRFLEKGLKLLVIYDHDNSKGLESQCLTCKRIVSPTIQSIRKSKMGCKYCAGTYVEPEEARQFMLSMGYQPLVKYSSTDKPWKCRHVICGSLCAPTYGTIKRGGGGCRNCADWGYSYDKDSYLYLIENQTLDSYKVGIANKSKLKKSDRLHRHGRDGWEIIKVWHFDNGKSPMELEALFFNEIREVRGIPIFLKKGSMKFEGETETFSRKSIERKELISLISKMVNKRGVGLIG